MSNRYRICLLVLILTVSLLSTTPLDAASRITWELADSVYDCSRPSITGAPPYTITCLSSVTAWEEEGTGVWTDYVGIACAGLPRSLPKSSFSHGPGAQPEVGTLLDETYVLVFVRGDSLVVREGDGRSDWTTVATEYLGPSAGVVGRIDLWCSPYPEYGDLAWLAFWAGDLPEGGLRFMRRSAAGWEPLGTVPGADSGSFGGAHPQVTEYDGPDAPLPRIYYVDMDELPLLMFTDWMFGGGWSTPAIATGGYEWGGEFDVASTPAGYAFLTTGDQPACPCNIIHFHEWTWGMGWHYPIDMTVSVDHYDWPMSPQIASDLDGDVHAFWYQLGSDPGLEPHTKRLCYWIRTEGVWVDRSDDLAEQQDTGLAEHVSMAPDGCGGAVLAWARRDTVETVPQNQRIWQSYVNYCAGDAGDPPTARLRVVAAPNPFNPTVVISASGDGAVVAAEIFDALGRRVARLSPSKASGVWSASWHGRDDRGREQPSGTYLVRVRDETGAIASRKITLTR